MNNKMIFGLTLAMMAIMVAATVGQTVSASLCCDNWSIRGGDHNHSDNNGGSGGDEGSSGGGGGSSGDN